MSAVAREGCEPAADESFLARLEALAEHHYYHRHPLTALMHAGRLELDDLRVWAANHYHLQTRLPIADALIVAKSEDPAFRRLWVQRLLARDGRSEPSEPGAAQPGAAEPGGIELWQRLAAGLGLGPAELSSGVYVLPEVRAVCEQYIDQVRDAELVTAVACFLTEHFAGRLAQAWVDAWREHYAFVEDGALECFTRSVVTGRGNADLALAFVRAHATTPELERCCLEAFTRCCALCWGALDAIYFERRRRRAPYIENRVWLMRLSALAVHDATGRHNAPGVLMAPERTLSLSHTAYELLERCDGQRTLERIVNELAERHAVSSELVARDVATFIGELERRHLLSFRS